MAKYSIQSIIDWLRAGYPDGIPPKDHFALLAVLARRLTDDEVQQVVDTAIATAPDQPGHPIDANHLRQIAEGILREEPSEADIDRVTERLTAGGWPVIDGDTVLPATGAVPIVPAPADTAAGTADNRAASDSVEQDGPVENGAAPTGAPAPDPVAPGGAAPRAGNGSSRRTAGLPPFLASVVDWLREGYPDGIDEHDYVALFALLRRRLSEDEVAEVADRLVADGDLPITEADIGVLITRVTDDMPAESDVQRIRARLEAAGLPLEWPSR